MELVVDTNILVSAVLKPGLKRELILSGPFSLFCPIYLLSEFSARQDEYVAKSRRDQHVFQPLVNRLLFRLQAIEAEHLYPYADRALAVCPHRKDWPFFAAALLKNCGIWTEEKRLKDQDVVPIYSTGDLADFF